MRCFWCAGLPLVFPFSFLFLFLWVLRHAGELHHDDRPPPRRGPVRWGREPGGGLLEKGGKNSSCHGPAGPASSWINIKDDTHTIPESHDRVPVCPGSHDRFRGCAGLTGFFCKGSGGSGAVDVGAGAGPGV